MELTSIIAAVDFSAPAQLAAHQAAAVARHTRARLSLVHIAKPASEVNASRGVSLLVARLRRPRAESRQQLATLRDEVGADVKVADIVVDKSAVDGLCTVARRSAADLLVLGASGADNKTGLGPGRVAESVARQCESSVMLTRGAVPAKGGFPSILVPTDFSPHAEAALRIAGCLAAPGGQIDLLHCWELSEPPASDGYGPEADELSQVRSAIESAANEQGAELLRRYSRGTARVTFQLANTQPAAGILERLHDVGYSLVVLADQGNDGARFGPLGTTTEMTVQYAPCTVAVIRPRFKPQDAA